QGACRGYVALELVLKLWENGAAVRQVTQVVLERSEPRDGLSPDLEGRHAVGDPLLGLGQDAENRLPQPGQGAAPGLVQSVKVLVNFQSGHRSIVPLASDKQALPGIGEEALVTLRGPASLAD